MVLLHPIIFQQSARSHAATSICASDASTSSSTSTLHANPGSNAPLPPSFSISTFSLSKRECVQRARSVLRDGRTLNGLRHNRRLRLTFPAITRIPPCPAILDQLLLLQRVHLLQHLHHLRRTRQSRIGQPPPRRIWHAASQPKRQFMGREHIAGGRGRRFMAGSDSISLPSSVDVSSCVPGIAHKIPDLEAFVQFMLIYRHPRTAAAP